MKKALHIRRMEPLVALALAFAIVAGVVAVHLAFGGSVTTLWRNQLPTGPRIGPGPVIPAANIESTQQIGARFDPSTQDDFFTAAAFVPRLSREEGISRAISYLKQRNHWDAITLHLPIRTTVGLFTGRPEGTHGWVKGLKVRVVVFDNVPVFWSGGIPSPGETVKQPEMSRFTMVLDDATGQFVYGTITGGSASLTNADGTTLGIPDRPASPVTIDGVTLGTPTG